MKRALIDENNMVVNIIMVNDDDPDVAGFINKDYPDDHGIGVGWTYNPDTDECELIVDPDAWKVGLEWDGLRRLSYPDLGELADALYHQQNGNNVPMEEYLAKCQAVKDQYPKPAE